MKRLFLKAKKFTRNFDFQNPQKPSLFRPILLATCITFGSFAIADDYKKKKYFSQFAKKIKKQYESYGLRPLQQHEVTLYSIIGLNLIVFALWKSKYHNFASRNFLDSPYSKPHTIITSVFSHSEPLHLLFNMWALLSFGSAIHKVLGREDFLAFYLSCGAFASLGSRILKKIRRNPHPSLGASGAIMGLLGLTAMLFPNVNIGIIFLPFQFNIQYGVIGIAALDLLGVILKWKTFDHVAHLAGLAFGFLFYKIIEEQMKANRNRIQRKR